MGKLSPSLRFVGPLVSIQVATLVFTRSASGEATITLSTGESDKVLDIYVEARDPGVRYNVLLIDPQGGEYPLVFETNTREEEALFSL